MNLNDAARHVIAAIDIEGSHPDYHQARVKRLREEWPSLWRAIEELRHAVT